MTTIIDMQYIKSINIGRKLKTGGKMKKTLLVLVVLLFAYALYGQDVLQQFMYTDDFNLVNPLLLPDGTTPIPDGSLIEIVITATVDVKDYYADPHGVMLNNNFGVDYMNGGSVGLGEGFFLTESYFNWEDLEGSPPEPVANCFDQIYLRIFNAGTIEDASHYITSEFIIGPAPGSGTSELEVGGWTDWEAKPGDLDPPLNLDYSIYGEMQDNVHLTWDAPGGGYGSSILVVDRDGSFDGGYTDDYVYFQDALDANAFEYDYFEVEDISLDGPDLDTILLYDIVIWFSGEAWGYYGDDCMTETDENNLATFLDQGGALFFSGQDYLYASYSSAGDLPEGSFPYDYLGLRSVLQDAWTISSPSTGTVEGVAGSFAEGFTFDIQDIYTTTREGLYVDNITDHVGMDLFNLTDPAPPGICALQYENGFKTAFTTASFAAITDPTVQADLMAAIIDYLSDGTRDLLGYNVYRDGGQINGDLVTETEYDDLGLSYGTYEYYVTAVYDEGESVPSEPVEVTILGWGTINGTVTDAMTGDPLEGAVITAGEYSTTTIGDGTYSMDVLEGLYDVTCEFPPYASQTLPADVPAGGSVTVDFALFEEVDPPNGVEAVEQPDGEAVDLTWNAPGGGTPTEFRYDDGVITGQLGYTGGNITALLGAAHFHHAILEDVSWYSTSEGGPHSSINFIILGLDGNGIPDVNDILYEGYGLPGIDDQWNVHTLPEAVEAENGFYLGYNFAGFAGLGTDDGVGDPYPYIPNTQYITSDWTAGNDWHTPDEYEFPLNFSIRANGLDLGVIEYREDFVFHPNKIKNENFSAGSPIEPRYGGRPKYRYTKNIELSRDLEGYEVYRLLDGEQENPGVWTLLDDTVTETYYTDETWPPAESGLYLWAVTAVYTGGNISDAAFSNIIDYGLEAEVTINVTTNAGDDPLGAEVILTNQDGDPDHVYTMTAPTGGVTVFPAVWLGTYDLEITLDGYEGYFQTDIEIMEDTELDAELTELLFPPSNLEVTYEGQDVTLTWMAPGTYTGFVEDFEEGVLPEGWDMTTNSAQGWFITQEGSSAYWTIPPHTWYACSNDDMAYDDGSVDYLIAPPQDFSYISEITMTFQSFFNASYSQTAHIEVSEDGGATWTNVMDCPDADDWQEVTVDLSDYCGTGHDDVLIAFHSNDNGAWASGWAVDDVVLGDVVVRELLGYNLYRNEEVDPINDDLIQETTYFDEDVPIGTYRYDLTAVYSTGESDPVIWEGGPVSVHDPNFVARTILGTNFPNPFNPMTTISFALRQTEKVNIDIYNVKGEKVKTLVNNEMDPGHHSAIWNGKDNSGKNVASGVYFYKMKAGKYASTKKMILMK